MKTLVLAILLAAAPAFGQSGYLVYFGCNSQAQTPCANQSGYYVAPGSGNDCECGGPCNAYYPPGDQWWISASAGYHLGPTGCPPYDPGYISSTGGVTYGSGAPNGLWASASAQSYYGSVWYTEYDYCLNGGDVVYYGNPYSTLVC